MTDRILPLNAGISFKVDSVIVDSSDVVGIGSDIVTSAEGSTIPMLTLDAILVG